MPFVLRLQPGEERLDAGCWRPLAVEPGRRLAWYACPRCGAVGPIGADHSISVEGLCQPSLVCPEGCWWEGGHAKLAGWPGLSVEELRHV